MGTIYIDDRPVEFNEGDNVLEATKRAGIEVPYFCYHPALGSVGSCRACAMETVPQKEGERPRVVMSCTIKAAEGMRFKLQDDKPKQIQKNVVEFYMTNHPNDCPVCDEGGDCHLQDMTVLSGHAYRRYDGTKRTAPNQFLGPLVWNTANRCITCYRCVRFYQEYALGDDFGVMGSRNNVSFRRTDDGAFDSPFAGNLITVCPTGTFTDKVFRRKYARTWMLDKGASVCNHCSVGCNIQAAGRQGTLREITPRGNDALNAHFICDRGRYGAHAAEAKSRPLTVYKKGQKLHDADAGKLFKQFLQEGTKGAILGSEREDLQGNLILRQLAREIKVPFSAFADPELEHRTKLAVSHSDNTPSIPEIEKADCVLVIGELTEHAPMMELAVRQALKKQAPVLMLHSAPSILASLLKKHPKSSSKLCPSNLWEQALGKLSATLSSKSKAAEYADWAKALKAAENPVILGVAELMNQQTQQQIAQIAKVLPNSKLGFALPAAGSYAASLLSEANSSEKLLASIENGEIESLLIVGNDPLSAINAPRWNKAFEQIKQLVVIDSVMSETAKRADLLLPAAAHVERSGLNINYEGRIQAFEQSYQREEPLFRPEQLKLSMSSAAQQVIDADLAQLILDKPSAKGPGIRLSFSVVESLLNLDEGNSPVTLADDKGLHLELAHWHGDEQVAGFVEELNSLKPLEKAQLSESLAKSINVGSGDHLTLQGEGGSVALEVVISPQVAPYSIALSRASIACLGNYPGQNIQVAAAGPLFKDACANESQGEAS
ncbi:NADH-quinone oxidoreductase subunit NuoG [Dongshaea marina]|uniref:NADH-quinone oxidoreductase subunit NuoG n=1 Tax=Dongshaea marina TaxID=2047966 RepID=UPI000D3EC5FF|nr:NADH-quinone oxidoreductase subunit NuoG [Dongshaea marina]